jgi:hypothetical protein
MLSSSSPEILFLYGTWCLTNKYRKSVFPLILFIRISEPQFATQSYSLYIFQDPLALHEKSDI